MANKKGHNKKKRERKKNEKIKSFLNIDLCACGCAHQLRCEGVCRESHMNSKTGEVECVSLYQIDPLTMKQGNQHSSKRTWKYGRQKDVNDNKQSKQQRREKRERDQLE